MFNTANQLDINYIQLRPLDNKGSADPDIQIPLKPHQTLSLCDNTVKAATTTRMRKQ
jgi:hypothetical protein